MMLVAFGLYVTILIGIAVYAVYEDKRSQGSAGADDDFILGGRTLSYWVTALSAHAADMSIWLFMGFPGAIYLYGSSKVWLAVALVIGMFLSWQLIASRLRTQTERYKSYTLASFFQRRYDDQSGMIGLASSIVIILFSTIYLAVGIKGVGSVFNHVFGVSYFWGALMSVLAIIFYATLGGYLAVAWTDAFQAIFLLGALLITAVVGFMHCDGWSAILAGAVGRNVPLTFLPYPGLKGVAALLLDPVGWGLGYFGMPHILSKFMGARDVAEMHKAKYIGILWQCLALGAAVAVACVGFALFPNGLANPETVFIDMVVMLFSPFAAGLIMCAILAAVFSTMDSQILVLAGIVTDDFYKHYVNPKATRANALFVYRVTIGLVSLIAFYIASDEHGSTIFNLVEYAWGGLGASFGPLVLASLYSHRVNKYGAASGIMVGGMVAAWARYGELVIWGLPVTPVLPGFLIGGVAIFFVSWLTSNYSTVR